MKNNKPIEFVYFISNGDFIKIGKTSRTPSERMSALQTGSSLKLIFEGAVVGGLAKENELHNRFIHLHERGEWFKFKDDLKVFVGELKEIKNIHAREIFVCMDCNGTGGDFFIKSNSNTFMDIDFVCRKCFESKGGINHEMV